MKLAPKTLRGRLTLWYCAVLTIVLAVFGISLYLLVRLQLLQHYDPELRDTARRVEDVLSRREDCEHLASDQLDDLNQFARLILFHAVEGDRKIFYRSPDLASLRVARDLAERSDFLKREASFQTYPGPLVSFRVYTLPYRSRAGRQGLIRVIESLGDVENPLARLRLALFLLTPLGVFASSAVGYWLAGRALAPVDQVTRLAREIEASQLSRRLPKPSARDEIGRLAETFNQMIARLEASFEAMKRFTADASHELRSPLTTMRGTIDVALGQPRETEQYRSALASVGEEVDRLRRIVEGLLVLARADAGRLPLEHEDVRLDVLAAEVVESFQERAASSGLALIASAAAPVTVKGDERWLRQLAFNLVENAVKFSAALPHENGEAEVRVEVTAANGVARLAVADSGPGIPESDLTRVFERFYRADWARTHGPKDGFGLGLAIASWIVKSHGGGIEAQRRTEGGTRMVATLPLARATPPGSSASAAL